jgi:LPXTG-site transpeptidase (sortase) family protein
MKALSYLLIIFGILWCLLGGYYLWQRNDPNRLQFKNVEQKQIFTQKEDQKKDVPSPKRVLIKNLGIDLALIPATVTNDIWETTYEGASYLTSSPIPGETGNSIIYAHNWTSLFGNLTKVKPGQVIEIVYTDGSKKKFIVSNTATVGPTESNILADSEDKRITLYTCTGFLDSKRFVVIAKLDEADLSFNQVARP